MSEIHPSAIIGKGVILGEGTRVGPHVIIEERVTLGKGNVILANAYLGAGSEIGDQNTIHMGAVVGHVPQIHGFDAGIDSGTRIGNRNQIRENVTIHRGGTDGALTTIGDDNLLMANVHVAHDCVMGNQIVMANNSSLTGHCSVGDQVFISGMVGLHQFTRIGRLAMISALSGLNKDLPPFMTCGGRPGRVQGPHAIGLKRAGVSMEARREIRAAHRLLYRSGLNVTQACEQIEAELQCAEVAELLAFIRDSKRGICAGPRKDDNSLGDEVI